MQQKGSKKKPTKENSCNIRHWSNIVVFKWIFSFVFQTWCQSGAHSLEVGQGRYGLLNVGQLSKCLTTFSLNGFRSVDTHQIGQLWKKFSTLQKYTCVQRSCFRQLKRSFTPTLRVLASFLINGHSFFWACQVKFLFETSQEGMPTLCGNCGNSLSLFLCKNFVKLTHLGINYIVCCFPSLRST